MVAVQAGSPVLILGELAVRLELELASFGMSCAIAQTANDAVARMKTTRFPFVVVPPTLSDMAGVDFIHGVLRHFDANVVLYGNGVDASEISALLRTGRVAHFPAHADGHVIADFLARRSANNGAPITTPVPTSRNAFNLTPGPPPSTPTPGAFQNAPNSSPQLSASLLSSPFSSFPPSPGAQSPFQSNAYPQQQAQQALAPFPPSPTPGFVSTPSAGFPAFAGQQLQQQQPQRSPSQPPGDARYESVVEELARTNSEIIVWKNKVAAAEQEKAALLVEVEAARRSAIADVAEVMALSDEGDPVANELEELKQRLVTVELDTGRVRSEAAALRTERDQLVAELAEKSALVVEQKARADGIDATVTDVRAELARARSENSTGQGEAEALRKERDAIRTELAVALAAAKSETETVRAELGPLRVVADELSKQVETAEKERDDAKAATQTAVTALDQRIATLETQRAELAAALAQAHSVTTGNADVEAALRVETEKLRADVGAARSDATTVRLDLQEALMRLDESSTSLNALREEAGQLRAEAGPLREWANQVVALHAQQQGEIERLRGQAGTGADQQRTIDALHKKIDLLEKQRAASPGPAAAQTGDVEVLLARSRQLADLVRALEPFMWGLTQATGFYTKAGVSGGDAHLKLLQQLQGVLLRLRDEIAMLDLG